MKIDIRHIAKKHATFEGEEPAEVFELEGDPFARPASGLRYFLTVDVLGSELLVNGTLNADFDVLCSRCGEFFSTNYKVSDFVRSFELEDGLEFIDLNPDMREEVVLSLPTYPACDRGDDCPNFQRIQKIRDEMSGPHDEGENPWGALDQLKLD